MAASKKPQVARSKLGFHSGPTGDLTGIGEFWQALSSAGIPIFHMCADNYGPLFQIAELLDNPHGVEHGLVWRVSKAGQNDGFDYDVPAYNLTPVQAAKRHWEATRAKIPKEFNPQKVWIKPINEVDKNRSDWLGRFAVEIAKLANAEDEGYKVTLFAWASGEPGIGVEPGEPDHWLEPGVLDYLRYCEQNPGKAAVSIHEYNFHNVSFADNYPWSIGRFQWLFDACDKNGITRPDVHITEWGWKRNSVPPWDDALDYINEANELYCTYPQIIGAAIWNLDSGWGGLNNQVLQYIEPLTDYTLSHEFESGGDNAPLDPVYFDTTTIPPDGKHKAIVTKMPQEAALSQWHTVVYEHVYQLRRTMTASTDDMITVLGGGNSASFAEIYQPDQPSQQEAISVLEAAGYSWVEILPGPATPSNPLDGLKLGAPFAVPFDRTSPFNAPRDYDGDGNLDDEHEGVDYDIFTNNPDSMENVLCLYRGVVTRSEDRGTAYGLHVIVRHERNGSEFFTWYAHMDDLFVHVGDAVSLGHPLGEIGQTGNSTGEHIHINLQVPGFGLSGYVVTDVVDPHPYIKQNTPPDPPQPIVDLTPYFAPNGQYGEFYVLHWPEDEDGNRKTQDMQLQRESAGPIVMVKGHEYERWKIDLAHIRRREDTSHEDVNGRPVAYRLDDGDGWSSWLPTQAEIGKVYTFETEVIKWHKDDPTCTSFYRRGERTYRKVVAVHANWVSPANPDIVLSDVVEIHWLPSESGGVPLEVYFMGLNKGYVAFGLGRVREAIGEMPQGRPPLQREVLPCLAQ